MADDRKRGTKSETLTIRLNPRTRFVLEFVARMRGQTITTVVERALEAAGDQAKIKQEFSDHDLTWKDFWDVSDGVRALKVAAEPELFPTYEEEKRLQFAKHFWEYFYMNSDCNSFQRVYVDILWPNIDKYITTHEETKQTDYYSVEREMRRALMNASVKRPKSKAGVEDPDTGRRTPPASASDPSKDGKHGGYDLDDDIPF